MEELSECPICKASSFEPFLKCIDYTVSKEEFQIVTCLKCGFKFTNPRPGLNSIGKYYDSEDYVSHSNTDKGLINKIYQFVKKSAIKKKIALIEGLNPAKSNLLDIGCGTGSFLGSIKHNGWIVKGIEPNEKARKKAIEEHSIEVYEENKLKVFSNGSFCVITMWHVLEHVHNLRERVEEISKLLEKDGYAVIAVPNHTSWDANHYKKYWAAYDVPRHLYHFSPKVIKQLFQEFNLTHLKSLPMEMDSFYVSMLSEKYKGSTFQYFKALFSGLLSNLKTKNDAEKYSSVIYIFKK